MASWHVVTGVDWLVDGGATHGFQRAIERGRATESARGI